MVDFPKFGHKYRYSSGHLILCQDELGIECTLEYPLVYRWSPLFSYFYDHGPILIDQKITIFFLILKLVLGGI